MTPGQIQERKRESRPSVGTSADQEDKRILVIDDEKVMLESCQKILKKAGYRVEAFDNGKEGIARFRLAPPPVLVVDLKMPDINGLQVIEKVREINPDAVIVVITGYATVAAAVEAMKAGAYDFLPKPFTPDELRLIINRGYERWHLSRESQRLQREKEEIRRNFITLVSHQLKSPLVAVRQCLDALEFVASGELSEDAVKFISRAQARTDDLLATIKDWLTLSKLKRGVKCDEYDSVELADVVDQVVKSYRQQAESAGITVRFDAPLGLPKVRGDAACVGVLVANLLSNAIKYNRPGGTAEIRTSQGGESVELKVIDTGIGIPEQCLPRIFSEFYRVKSEKTKNISGTGLGLTICQAIVSELGGSIEVSNNEIEGSTFNVHLPAAQEEK
jgi:two-component system sensor histidine kinase/response regulator